MLESVLVTPSTPIASATPDIRDVGEFVAEYSAWLRGCGATCARIEKNGQRIARAYGFDADLTIMPQHVNIWLTDKGSGHQEAFASRQAPCGINFSVNTELSRLSWAIADGQVTFAEAVERLRRIVTKPYRAVWYTPLFVAVANASFCRLFGGDAGAMAVVFVATLAGYILKILMMWRHYDVRLILFVCAFVSSALSACAYRFAFTATPEISVATSVLYLIPGVPYINCASDLFSHHYLCAISRLVDAVVLTVCLSAGLCLGISLMGLNLLT